jgi:hypothetical protein
MYVAPDAVNAYLCRQKRLHEVPVFKNETHYSDTLKDKFYSYYISNYKFVTRKSKYSNEKSTGVEDISSRRVIRLSANIDTAALEETERELAGRQRTLEANQARLRRNKETLEKLKEDELKLSQEVTRLTNKKKEFANRQNELIMKERTLESLMEPQVRNRLFFSCALQAVLWIRNNPNVLAGSESVSEKKVRIRIRRYGFGFRHCCRMNIFVKN